MTDAGDRFGHVEAIGLREVDVRAKAQFEHQQRMIEQVGTPTRGGEVVFADPDQGRFEIGARGMGRPAWPTPGRYIDGAPVKEGETLAVALHDGIGVAHLLDGGLVKWSRDWYDRDHEGCSCQSRVAYHTSTLSGSWPLCQGSILETSFACDNSHSGDHRDPHETHIRDKLLQHINSAMPERQYRFFGHRLAELRGLFTNVIHNELVTYFRERYGEEACIDLQYYTEGVNYLLDKEIALEWTPDTMREVAARIESRLAAIQLEDLAQFIKASPSGIVVDEAAIASGAQLSTDF